MTGAADYGFVLGGIIEQNLIRGLMYANGNFLVFFTSPVAAVCLGLAVVYMIYLIIKQIKMKREQH
ncbi:MAG: hypothetical protein LKE40_13700 [Spirochaetia bacterium]|nr:hypothetical protein [Spirochaetia bacterium]